MTKRLHAKKERSLPVRSHQTLSATMKREYAPTLLILVVLLGSTLRQPMRADNAGANIFGGAATGALIGGIAGGGRGAGYGALAGAAIGGIASAASSNSGSSNDPYRKLDKEESKLRKLEDRLDRASDRKRPSLERQVERQTARVNELRSKLGIRMPA